MTDARVNKSPAWSTTISPSARSPSLPAGASAGAPVPRPGVSALASFGAFLARYAVVSRRRAGPPRRGDPGGRALRQARLLARRSQEGARGLAQAARGPARPRGRAGAEAPGAPRARPRPGRPRRRPPLRGRRPPGVGLLPRGRRARSHPRRRRRRGTGFLGTLRRGIRRHGPLRRGIRAGRRQAQARVLRGAHRRRQGVGRRRARVRA